MPSVFDRLQKMSDEMEKDALETVRADFAKHWELAIDLLKKQREQSDAQLRTEIDDLINMAESFLKELASGIKEKSEKAINTALDDVNTRVDKALKDQETGMNLLRDKLAEIEDREMEDEDEEDDYTETARELENLPEEDKMTTKAIARLDDILDEIRTQITKIAKTNTMAVGGNASRNFIKEVDISSNLDGSTKTFNIGAFYRIITIDLSSFPHTLRKTVDYTYDGNAGTITFTNEIDASTSLASGQTCIITLVTT